ncbi:MAG: zinc-binding alcohol dehydrogenase, partial [Chloroflexota bacterium]
SVPGLIAELLVYRGQVPSTMAVDETLVDLQGNFTFPIKYGYAVVGQVVEIGADVPKHWQDQWVFAFHPHESHFVTTPQNVLPLPDGMSPEDAVFLPNMESAVNLIMDGRPLLGERVVLFGQGIVGLLATALLSQYPLHELITIEPFPKRREASLTVGAHRTLDPADLDQMIAHFQEKDSSQGADLVYELSGNPKALNQAIDLASFASRIIVGSWYGTKQATLDLGSRFHRQRIQLISSQVSTIAPEFRGRWTKSRRIQLAWRMLETIKPARFITHRFHISQAEQAYQLLDKSPEQAIQVILSY